MSSIAFEDLRNSPTILIGYSSDQWAPVSSKLRFYIDDERGFISDNGKPTPWFLHHSSRDHSDEDYAIVSRVFDRQTHAMLVEATGIKVYGTKAAGEVITNPDMNGIANYPATP